MREGRFQQAAALYGEILAADPRQADALHMLGVTKLQTGDAAGAVELIAQAVELRPPAAAMHNDLGLALHAMGRFDAAEASLRQALRLLSDSPEVLLNLGNLLRDQGKLAEAMDCYRNALEGKPGFPEARHNLALVYLKLGRPDEALASCRAALALRPQFPEAYQTLGNVLDRLGRLDEAIAAHQRAIALKPEFAAAHFDLGTTLLGYGRLDEALACYRAALALEPAHAEWHRLVSQVVAHAAGDSDIETMRALHTRSGARPPDRMHLAFGLGKALDDVGQYQEAFDYFLEGNALKRASFDYDRTDSERAFADVKASFSPEFFGRGAGAGNPDATPIFVLGMPRSGTTLVEQVLASHPEIVGAGEFTLLNNLVGTLNGGAGPLRFGAIAERLGGETLNRLGEAYVGQLRAYGGKVRFITDKLPGNFMLIGMIKLMLPNARIIHCRRHAVDNCVSIFKTYFSAVGLRYAYDLGEVGHYYALYRDLMAHWHRVLPGAIYDLDYEKLVGSQESESRALLAHCGLDWRDECLDFFNTARPVHTASAVQVRRPIYKSSIGMADRYRNRLKPLLEAVEERN